MNGRVSKMLRARYPDRRMYKFAKKQYKKLTAPERELIGGMTKQIRHVEKMRQVVNDGHDTNVPADSK